MQTDGTAGSDDRREVQSYPEFAELNGHGTESASPALQRRVWELTAGEETGGPSIDREDIRLRKRLQKVSGFERLDGCAEVQIGPKQEYVQQILIGDLHRLPRTLSEVGRSELPSCNPADRVGRSRADDIQPKILSRGAIHVRKADPQQDLRFSGGHAHSQKVDRLGQAR